jgi:phosphoribosylglycinamide formyltransferase 1
MPTLNLGFFASHGGSNMQAIIDSIKARRVDARACVVISNNSNSGALERAKNEGIPYYHLSSLTHPDENELQRTTLDILKLHSVDTIILAGYMKKLGKNILDEYKGRILNIHPALLPKYGGKGMFGIHVHEAVLAAGDKETGVTIHLVDEFYDNGRILAQKKVPVMPDDTPEALADRVLVEEHKLYSEVLHQISEGKIQL